MIRFFGGRVMTLANGIETQDIEVWTEGSKIVFVGNLRLRSLTERFLNVNMTSREISLCRHLKMRTLTRQ